MKPSADVLKHGIMPDDQSGVGSSSLSIRSITIHEARPFYERHHYSHAAPNGSHYGLFLGAALVGCATFKSLSGGNMKSRSRYQKFAEAHGFVVKELSRLALSDYMPQNTESWFISQLITRVRAAGVDVLLSYADPTYNHVGIIYRATNWLYYGISTGHADRRGSFVVDGRVIGQSSLRRYAGVTSAKGREEALRAEFGDRVTAMLPKPQKHVYLYPVSRRARRPLTEFVEARRD